MISYSDSNSYVAEDKSLTLIVLSTADAPHNKVDMQARGGAY